MRAASSGWALLLLEILRAPATAAAETESEPSHEFSIRSESYARLFERALLPGPEGAIVRSERAAPLYEYLRIEARRVDSPLGDDTLKFEVSAWGSWQTRSLELVDRFDGDLQTASATLHTGDLTLRLGRQHVAGGAARFVRFDGFWLAIPLAGGFTVAGYAGFGVLPRFSEHPGYYHLGDARDSLLREPSAILEPEREQHWLLGTRLSFAEGSMRAGVSFHEQHETGGLTQRNLAADATWMLSESADAGGRVLGSLDSQSIADLRLWLDVQATENLSLFPDYARSEPAQLLSRQSVLSVFASDGYQELGGSAHLRASPALAFDVGGWGQWFDTGDTGGRFATTLRVTPNGASGPMVLLRYGRVISVDNGYHALRSAVSTPLHGPLSATLDGYAYFYDKAIEGRATSSIYAGTLNYQLDERLAVLWGASVARSPYASLDVQSLVRLSYALALGRERGSF